MESRDGKPEDDNPAVTVGLTALAIVLLAIVLVVLKLLMPGQADSSRILV
ncbi:hypothetical protein LGR64_12230 [Delftia sp. Lp-1]|nr:hypothetical protein [Delftia sp. Lp-1]MCB4787047.1 hypothetical protein [Delftia sp. Lp-1]